MTTTVSATQAIDALWYTRCPVPTPLGLAAQLGWFDAEFIGDGLTIRTLQETSDPELRESHYDHKLPSSFRQGGNVPAIWARARGADTRVIGLNWIDEAQLIIALPQSGIESVAHLRGRRLALPKHDNSIDHARTGALRVYAVALELAGVSERDVAFVDIEIASGRGGPIAQDGQRGRGAGGYGPLIEALQNGQVDAIFVKGARGVEAAASIGAHVVIDLRNHPDPLVRANNGAPRPVTVDRALLDSRPDLVGRFLARIVAIGDWSAAHPAETVAFVARESGSSEQWVKLAYGEDLHLHQYTDLAETSIQALQGYKDFLFQRGFLAADFDVRDWIDPRPLAEIGQYLQKNSLQQKTA